MNNDWRHYPFALVPGDPQLDFPEAEGEHPDQESDTWFIAGQLRAAESDRSFAFLTIFNKNQPGGTVVADFYTLALFDLDNGDYGTYTDYDMPPANMKPGAQRKTDHGPRSSRHHLPQQRRHRLWPPAWTATANCCPIRIESAWSARITRVGPCGYDLVVTPTRAPIPLGGVDLQRQDRVLRPTRHVLLFPDRNGDDRNLALG